MRRLVAIISVPLYPLSLTLSYFYRCLCFVVDGLLAALLFLLSLALVCSSQAQEAEDRLREEGSRCSDLERALEVAEKRCVPWLLAVSIDLYY